jgi:transcriptional regulator with XRE-family HTH domain
MKFPSRQRAIASAIATARRQAQLSQRQLARKLGVPPNWIQRVESLERRVDVAEFIAIARAVDVDPQALLSRVLKGTA